MKKLLIISVSNGSGHVRAAEAVKKAIQMDHPDIVAEHIDMVDYIRLPMKTAVVSSYDLMIKQIPELWGLLYHKTDNAKVTDRYHHLSKLMHRMNATPLYEYIKQFQPDYILCTHFLPAQAIIDAPKQYRSTVPLAAVMTDYYNHSFLVHTEVDHYFVASEKLKWLLEKRGVAAPKITPSGIPIDPLFYEQKPVATLRKQYDITPNEKVVLVLSGGQGLAKINQIVKELFSLSSPITIIAIAGSNKRLQAQLSALKPPTHVTLRVLGWTDAIDEYMRIADAIITKPGGITTTECIALGKPIIAIQPIPGQEEYNAEYILERGYGHVAHGPDDLLYILEKTLRSPKQNAPHHESAARVIADTIVSQLSAI